MLAEEWFNSLPVVRHLHPSHPAQCVDICLLKDFFCVLFKCKVLPFAKCEENGLKSECCYQITLKTNYL